MSPEEELLDKIKKIVGVENGDLLLAKIRYYQLIAEGAETVYSVYVRTNSDGYITNIDSDAFIDDLVLWIKIDEGTGDLYRYAKNQYCKYGLTASDGSYNYKLVRGKAVYMPQSPTSLVPTLEERVNDLETAICDIMDMLAEM